MVAGAASGNLTGRVGVGDMVTTTQEISWEIGDLKSKTPPERCFARITGGDAEY
jgi:hypothetical protein